MKHILVTGGNGFIGRYVVEELKTHAYVVTVFDRHTYHTHPSIPPPYTEEGQVFGDIKDAALVTDAVAHVDGVIHLAGVLGTQETITNPLPAVQTNVLGGMNVLEACAQYDVPLVNIAVGNWWMASPYSITKNMVERFVEMYTRFRGSRFTTVRALNAYGPRQIAAAPYGPSRVRKIMPSFICRALDGLPIEVYGDGAQIMDMIFVEDVAEILVRALERTNSFGPQPTFEAGTGRKTTVNMIAEEVVKNIPGATIEYLPMRPGEDAHAVVVGDPETLRPLDIDSGDLTTLEDGVHLTVDHFKDYLKGNYR